jgi:hypothetical protein
MPNYRIYGLDAGGRVFRPPEIISAITTKKRWKGPGFEGSCPLEVCDGRGGWRGSSRKVAREGNAGPLT